MMGIRNKSLELVLCGLYCGNHGTYRDRPELYIGKGVFGVRRGATHSPQVKM